MNCISVQPLQSRFYLPSASCNRNLNGSRMLGRMHSLDLPNVVEMNGNGGRWKERACSGTKSSRSNGTSSSGLRRRYSFESLELKEGSSSGMVWSRKPPLPPKRRLSCRVLPTTTTLETIPPSPTMVDNDVHDDEDKVVTSAAGQLPNSSVSSSVSWSDSRLKDDNPIVSGVLSSAQKEKVDEAWLSSSSAYLNNGSYEEKNENENEDPSHFLFVLFSSPKQSINFLLDELFHETLVLFTLIKRVILWLYHCSNPLINPDQIMRPLWSSLSTFTKRILWSAPPQLEQLPHYFLTFLTPSLDWKTSRGREVSPIVISSSKAGSSPVSSSLLASTYSGSRGGEGSAGQSIGDETTNYANNEDIDDESDKVGRSVGKQSRGNNLMTSITLHVSTYLSSSFKFLHLSSSFSCIPSALILIFAMALFAFFVLPPSRMEDVSGVTHVRGGEGSLNTKSLRNEEHLKNWIRLNPNVRNDGKGKTICPSFPSSKTSPQFPFLLGQLKAQQETEKRRIFQYSPNFRKASSNPYIKRWTATSTTHSHSQQHQYQKHEQEQKQEQFVKQKKSRETTSTSTPDAQHGILKENAHQSKAQFYREEQAVWLLLSLLFTLLSSSCVLTLFLVYLHKTYYHQDNNHQQLISTSFHCSRYPRQSLVNGFSCTSRGVNGYCRENCTHSSETIQGNYQSRSCPEEHNHINQGYQNTPTSGDPTGLRKTKVNLACVQQLGPSRKDQYCHQSLAFTDWRSSRSDQQRKTFPPFPVPGTTHTPPKESEPEPESEQDGNKRVDWLGRNNRKGKCTWSSFGGRSHRNSQDHSNPTCHTDRNWSGVTIKGSHFDDVSGNRSRDNNNRESCNKSVTWLEEEDKFCGLRGDHPACHYHSSHHNNRRSNGDGDAQAHYNHLSGHYGEGNEHSENDHYDEQEQQPKQQQRQHHHNGHRYRQVHSRETSRDIGSQEELKPATLSILSPLRSCSPTLHYYFLHKFVQPDRVLFPILWTAFLLHFNFPNLPLVVQWTVIGVAIKITNCYHHYSYIATFWGGHHINNQQRNFLPTSKSLQYSKQNFRVHSQELTNLHSPNQKGVRDNEKVTNLKVPCDTHQPNEKFAQLRKDLLCNSSKVTVSLWLYFIVLQRLSELLLISLQELTHSLPEALRGALQFWPSFYPLLAHFLEILGLVTGQVLVEKFRLCFCQRHVPLDSWHCGWENSSLEGKRDYCNNWAREADYDPDQEKQFPFPSSPASFLENKDGAQVSRHHQPQSLDHTLISTEGKRRSTINLKKKNIQLDERKKKGNNNNNNNDYGNGEDHETGQGIIIKSCENFPCCSAPRGGALRRPIFSSTSNLNHVRRTTNNNDFPLVTLPRRSNSEKRISFYLQDQIKYSSDDNIKERSRANEATFDRLLLLSGEKKSGHIDKSAAEVGQLGLLKRKGDQSPNRDQERTNKTNGVSSSDDSDDDSGSTQIGSLSRSSSSGSLVLATIEDLHDSLPFIPETSKSVCQEKVDPEEISGICEDNGNEEPVSSALSESSSSLSPYNKSSSCLEQSHSSSCLDTTSGTGNVDKVTEVEWETDINSNCEKESEHQRQKTVEYSQAKKNLDLVSENELVTEVVAENELFEDSCNNNRSGSISSLVLPENTTSHSLPITPSPTDSPHMNCKGLGKKSASIACSSSSSTGGTTTGPSTKLLKNAEGTIITRRGSSSGINRAPTPPPQSLKGRNAKLLADLRPSRNGADRDKNKTYISQTHHKFVPVPPKPGTTSGVVCLASKTKHEKKDDRGPDITTSAGGVDPDIVLLMDQQSRLDKEIEALIVPPPPPSSSPPSSTPSTTTNIITCMTPPTRNNDETEAASANTLTPDTNIFLFDKSSYHSNGIEGGGAPPNTISSCSSPLTHQPPPHSTSSSSLYNAVQGNNTNVNSSSSTSSKRLFRSGSSQCCGVNSSTSSSPILHLNQPSTPPQQLQQQQQQDPSIEKYLSSKMRRTSLPAALPAQRTAIHHGSGGLDTALLYEAHGLVTEMLMDQAALPANIVAGLKALATLLKPTSTSSIHYSSSRPKPAPLTLAIDPDYTSDIDEIPYTGEKISTIPKRNSGQGKKGVSANILRRMSTSTWTTTTSATGMPTLEPQPHTRRRRSASFRSGALGPSHRRYSQHELSSGQVGVEHGQRKTLCSLHPLSPSDLTHLSALAASTGFTQSSAGCGSNTIKSASASVSAAGSNRSSPASTPIPSPIPSPVPSRDPSPCHHRKRDHDHRDSLLQQDLLGGSSDNIGPSGGNGGSGGNGMSLCREQQRASTGNLLTLNNNNNNSKVMSCGGSGGGSGGQLHSPTASNCRQPHHLLQQDYSPPPKVLFQSGSSGTMSSCSKPGESSFSLVTNTPNATGSGALIFEGDSLGLLSGKTPADEDNCSTTSTLGDGPGLPDNSSGNSNSLRLSPVTFTLHEPPDINEPYFSTDEDGREDVVVTSDGIRFDLQNIAVDPLLCRLHEWDYPIFDLQESSKTQILSHMCYKVFLETGLFETFRIPIKEFITYFHALELGYRDKPYHNRMHAGDVLHGVYYLTSQAIPGFQMVPADPETPSASDISGQRAWFSVEEASYGIMGANFTSLELMAMYVAAAMHDYDHPGRTNAFLVSTHAKEAILYNDRSVLENHHAAAAWSLLMSNDDCNFLKYLDKAEFKRFRYLVIEAILATDLKRHFEIVAEFNSKVNEDDSPGIDWTQEEDRLLVMEICIKLADINGPCKVHDIHVQWTYRIAEEFYEQGDEEAELGLPISPFMDRDHPQLAKLQESFINHLVAPLCKACAEAGILPGYWIEDQDDDDGDPEIAALTNEDPDFTTTDDLSIATTSCQETDNENDESSYSDDNPTNFCNRVIGGGHHSSKRKIFCLQTKHLQDNHKHWMTVIKEESKKKDEVVPPVKTESVAISTEDPMETIEEENNTPHSLNRSFSFEKEDSKL